MSLIHGINNLFFFAIPMLGDRHPAQYPRFRHCFLADDEHPEYDNHIHVYTRVGGNNRGCGFGEEELYKHPNFVTSFDDSFDPTYATYVFSVPDQWKSDWELVVAGKIAEVSRELQLQVRKVFPKFKAEFDELWPDTKIEEEPEKLDGLSDLPDHKE